MHKVIILYDYFSPAFKAGGPIQSLENLVNGLKGEFRFSIVCSNRDLDDTVLPVTPNSWGNKNGVKVFYNNAGFKGVQSAVPPGATIFINGLFTPIYTILPALFLKGRKIVSVRGMLHPGGLSQKLIKKRAYLWLCRLAGLQRKCEFHASTELEKEYIQRIFGKKVKVWVIPNLPNLLDYAPAPAKEPGHLRIATIALISPMKNHLSVIRALAKCNYQVRYDIYGAIKDNRYWQACLALAKSLPPNIQLIYHGPVATEAVDAILKDTDIYVQPSKAENFGHSLYEALAKGRPVVTSHHTPWNRLAETNAGFNIDPDNTDELLSAINHFAVMDGRELEASSLAASTYAEKAIDVEQIKRQYVEMFTGKPVAVTGRPIHNPDTIQS